jgi:hypothetical protein
LRCQSCSGSGEAQSDRHLDFDQAPHSPGA